MLRRALFSLLVAGVFAGGCKKTSESRGKQAESDQRAQPQADRPSKPRAGQADAEFTERAETFFQAHLQAHPGLAVGLGFHEWDGKLPELSEQALQAEIERLEQAEVALQKFDPSSLSELRRVERDVLLHEIRGQLFDLKVWRRPWNSPRAYIGPLSLMPYISRDYAPVEQRAQAVIAAAKAGPELLEDGRKNLEARLPKPELETAIKQLAGMVTFVEQDVPTALEGISDETDAKLRTALDGLAQALNEYRDFLKGRLSEATEEFALGEKRFLTMLEHTQGVDIELSALEDVARKDLERNLAAMKKAATEIDPKADVESVVEQVVADKPPADGVIELAEDQAERAKQFVIENDIVSIPSKDVAEVKPTPPFRRYNLASLGAPGPFESKPLPAFYYITPPDPSWPPAKQKAYVPGKTFLLFVTVHELWPGHFLHSLHRKQVESKILKAFGNYAMTEGWAHYTEQMMLDEGFRRGPEDHIGQLIQALMRNVRFLSAIGLHAKGMTVEESAELFEQKGFLDPGNAEQQAIRGTFDPMYLSYTLGKLMILKLREDWMKQRKAAGESATLQEFHDTFLSHGSAPVPTIRRAMLGQDSGPPL